MKKNTGIAVSSYDKEKSFENASYLRTYHDPDGEKNYELPHLFKLRFSS